MIIQEGTETYITSAEKQNQGMIAKTSLKWWGMIYLDYLYCISDKSKVSSEILN